MNGKSYYRGGGLETTSDKRFLITQISALQKKKKRAATNKLEKI